MAIIVIVIAIILSVIANSLIRTECIDFSGQIRISGLPDSLEIFLSNEKRIKKFTFYKKIFWFRYCPTKMPSSRASKSYFESFRFYLPNFAVVTKAIRSPRQINFIMSLSLRGQVKTSDSDSPIQLFYTFETATVTKFKYYVADLK